jgi:glutathione S-transferase
VKLYSIDLSPFAARVRAAIYFKRLPVELVSPPPDGLKSPEFLAINPLGRLPVLVLDDGTVVPESETIIEYLEDAYPLPALRPESPKERACVRLLARITECYVTAPMFMLFPQLASQARDVALVESQLARLDQGLGFLSRYLSDATYAYGDRPTTADCCVFPTLYLVDVVTPQLGRPGMLSGHLTAAAYFRRASTEPVLRRVLDEMVAGMKAAGYA